MNTANPIGSGANTYTEKSTIHSRINEKNEVQMKQPKVSIFWYVTYGDMGVSGFSLGIGGGEDGVDKNKGSNDLSSQASSFAVAIR